MGANSKIPREDEVEISIFGSGFGECVVVHFGNSEWMIIDSCVDRKSKKPVALQYLENININPKTAVKCFVITHWHNDHINGALEVLKECLNASFICSNALCSGEFLRLIAVYTSNPYLGDSGLDEICRIFDELENRYKSPYRQTAVPNWATANKLLLRKDGPIKAEIYALSPSDKAFSLAIREIGQYMPNKGLPRRRIVAQQPNHVSVAIWANIEEFNFLFGSDLENLKDDGLGWKAVILSRTRPRGKAVVVKVPHHGSMDAYCEEMWREMVIPADPIALLTPFTGGKDPLPTKTGLKALQNHTSEIYISGPTKRALPKLDPAVAKTLKEMVTARRIIEGPMGHVRVRFPIKQKDASPRVEFFEGAFKIE